MKKHTADSPQNAFIGIDFGTTKTMVASYDAGKNSARALTLGRGKFEKPTSMYATESGELLFGDDADDEGITDLPNHIRRFKMKLGRPGLAQVGRKSGTALELTADFLEHLRNQMEKQVLYTSVDRVVLTVPAIFGPLHSVKTLPLPPNRQATPTSNYSRNRWRQELHTATSKAQARNHFALSSWIGVAERST